ncbi:aquaporin NIP1-1-like [Coffea eugenioides]|uniref:aquaporin NIP1-1-like n=1 Tax=Coffea eugenioides TaxID=49369 RepID=UPI000F608B53|nr:aquaporin NIP1-1-like [Coffea eugenioides]
MAEASGANGNHGVALDVKDEDLSHKDVKNAESKTISDTSGFLFTVPFMQKLVAEIAGTYYLIFAGVGSVVINAARDNIITFPGTSVVWGLAAMVVVYSVGHISGAHLNPAITIAFATCKRFPWKQVPAYISAQVLGSTLASGTLRLLFQDHFAGPLPHGSDVQSLALEFIITFYLMFVICGVATDNRAIGELAGLAVGATVIVNVMIAGPISGGSMSPAGRLGPAIVSSNYKSLWVYILGPTAGAISGAWVYDIIRFTDKPLREVLKSGSFLKDSAPVNSN